MKKVAMIGLGKLGQDCAEVMAETYDVVGYDVGNRTPKFPIVNSIKQAVEGRDIIFIAVPTPHDAEYGGEKPTSQLPIKDFDYSIVMSVLIELKEYVNKDQLVVLISTVLPGTVRNEFLPLIDNMRFVYNPYLISMGTVKWDMTNPEMVIIGSNNLKNAEELVEFYKPLMQNNPRYEIGTWDEAESIKIFYNTFISVKITLANMIQDVAELNGNINVDVVTNALTKSTKNIMGPGFMRAGMGAAGACHPRDNIALRHLANRLDLKYDFFETVMQAREAQAELMAKTCLTYGNTITVIGKSYKPGVPFTHGSYSMLVGHYIENLGGTVHYYDPNTGDNDFIITDVYLISYWEEFVNLIEFPSTSTVIDPNRRLTTTQHKGQIVHYGNTRHL
jgi:UDPglucose 6-dehydrogenase